MSRDNFIPSALALAKELDKNSKLSWLGDYRKEQTGLLNKAQFPSQKVEHFKYNRLDIIDVYDFFQLAKIDSQSEEMTLDMRLIENLEADYEIDRIVFVNGEFCKSLSQICFHHITPFSKANSEQQEKTLIMLRQQDLQYNPFALLNSALCENGILVEVDENSPDALIEVLMIYQPCAVNTISASHILFDIADNAKATVISRAISRDVKQEQTVLTTTRSIINVGENSDFTHYSLQLENAHSLHFGTIEYNLHSKAKLDAFYAATGSNLKKMDIQVNHSGEYSYAGLDGLYVATDNQQIDYHTTINHLLPNGTTNENFRGIINGNAEGVFNGRIHIYKDAQKTLAELSNKNLLMSEGAVVHTKPELEIYADDVICAHGATVSCMDDESMYYLQARGIGKKEAELMLSLGFINELLADLPHQEIAEYIRPVLFSRFDNSCLVVDGGNVLGE